MWEGSGGENPAAPIPITSGCSSRPDFRELIRQRQSRLASLATIVRLPLAGRSVDCVSLELTRPQLNRKDVMRTGIGAMKQPILSDDLDANKFAEVALGLLALTIHDGCRAWKGMD